MISAVSFAYLPRVGYSHIRLLGEPSLEIIFSIYKHETVKMLQEGFIKQNKLEEAQHGQGNLQMIVDLYGHRQILSVLDRCSQEYTHLSGCNGCTSQRLKERNKKVNHLLN